MVEDIISGVTANFVFLLLIALLSSIVWGCFYGKKMLDATQFFGVGFDGEVYIYVSAHADPETWTRRVITAREFEAVFESHGILANQFHTSRLHELAIAIFQLLQLSVRIPDFVVRASPLDEISAPQTRKSLISVGGPTRNQVSKYYLNNHNSWLTFDDNKKKFLINRGDRNREELNPSGKIAIINKIIVENSVAFIIFGFGEIETTCALKFFVHNWRTLHNEFGKAEFGVCLLVEDEGKIQVLSKLSDD